jgi:hypothetical protein
MGADQSINPHSIEAQDVSLGSQADVSARAARTNCLPSNPAELPENFQMIVMTTESARLHRETPIEDGSHRFHKTICSTQGGSDIAAGIREGAQLNNFGKCHR